MIKTLIKRFSCLGFGSQYLCYDTSVCVCCAAMNRAASSLFSASFTVQPLGVCVCVWVWGSKKHIMFFSPGNHDQPNSLRSLVMQLFLHGLPQHVPPAVHQTWLMAGSLQHNICRQPSKCIPAFVFLGFYLQFSSFLQPRCYEIFLVGFLWQMWSRQKGLKQKKKVKCEWSCDVDYSTVHHYD